MQTITLPAYLIEDAELRLYLSRMSDVIAHSDDDEPRDCELSAERQLKAILSSRSTTAYVRRTTELIK